MAKKPVPHMDALDLEAAREGQSIKSANEVRVQKTSKKSKIESVNSKVLDEAWFGQYGYSGYVARAEDVDDKG